MQQTHLVATTRGMAFSVEQVLQRHNMALLWLARECSLSGGLSVSKRNIPFPVSAPYALMLVDGDGTPLFHEGVDIPPPLRRALPPSVNSEVRFSGPVMLKNKECLLLATEVKNLNSATLLLALPLDALHAALRPPIDAPENLSVLLQMETDTGILSLHQGARIVTPPNTLQFAQECVRRNAFQFQAVVPLKSFFFSSPGAEKALSPSKNSPQAVLVCAISVPWFQLHPIGIACAAGIALVLSGACWWASGKAMPPPPAPNTPKLRDAVRRLRRRLDTERGQRCRLSGELIRMLEEMRDTLAQELHDQAGQRLTTLLLKLDALGRELIAGAVTPSQAAAGLESASEDVRCIQNEIRALAKKLRPPSLDVFGLPSALETLADDYRRAGLDVRLFQDAVPPLSKDVALALYRICQEALTNALRHAQAHSVHISLMGRDRRVCLTVEDDGCGFTPGDTAKPGLGLTLMRERAAQGGGSLRLESTPGQGTVIMAEFPLSTSLSR